MSGCQKNLPHTFHITVQDGRYCESFRCETILSALTRSSITLSAPCGGRGICGKCHIVLRKGKIKIKEEKRGKLKPGDSFPACRGIALSDITIELPEANTGLTNTLNKEKSNKNLNAGVAIDIGTTTVQLEIFDLDTGENLETISALNAQRSFGADVMSRINAAGKGKTQELFTALNRQIEEMLQYCICTWGLSGIKQCSVSGNTTMLHFFCGTDPSGMGKIPFTPVFLENRNFSGKELNLSVDSIIVLPGISAFVGADIVSGLAYLDILNHKENAMLVDIGTNGEIALWRSNEQRLLCTSTAAGPCFEGAEISCGIGALPGAINRISIKEKKSEKSSGKIFHFGPLSFTTIDNIPPRGICGAGLIDAFAVMKNLGVMDETGVLSEEYAEKGFPISDGITVSQKDIRQFQLAKSAILSGITILCKRAGFKNIQNLGPVYIAGGLGFYINPDNAATVGLLPPEFTEKSGEKKNTIVCGNTSLKGAAKCLFDPTFLPYCREIITRSNTENLAAETDFTKAFAENMYFK
ncbi:MAG: ASKHA domain-containing protein [Treponema sp.]|nr:ASKHA domain-containing protein [Treponema sp.]